MPERHLTAAERLGADCRGATPDDAGEVSAEHMITMMRAADLPNGLSALGFEKQDAKALADSASRQKRAIANAPREIGLNDIESIFEASHQYW
jgi:alcohol dehydrogenase class IV